LGSCALERRQLCQILKAAFTIFLLDPVNLVDRKFFHGLRDVNLPEYVVFVFLVFGGALNCILSRFKPSLQVVFGVVQVAASDELISFFDTERVKVFLLEKVVHDGQVPSQEVKSHGVVKFNCLTTSHLHLTLYCF